VIRVGWCKVYVGVQWACKVGHVGKDRMAGRGGPLPRSKSKPNRQSRVESSRVESEEGKSPGEGLATSSVLVSDVTGRGTGAQIV